jgi:pimeloyl-ACP methyl ester carboxylesterase
MDIYYEERGNLNGTSIVFIHGGAMNGEMWRSHLEYFKDYHCIIVDLPEHGKSVNLKPFTVNDSANYIANIIKKRAKGGKAHVIGHSLGAIVLVELLSNEPNLIDHAVVASGNLRPSFIYNILALSIVCRIQSYIIKRNGKNDYVTPEMLKRLYVNVIENLRIPNGLDIVKVPTLLIAGEKENKFLKESNIDLSRILTKSSNILIKGVGHSYPWLDSSTFIRVVMAWIDDKEIIDDMVISVK